VSESKFKENPSAFIGPIRSRDRAALEALITKPEVERRLLLRLRKKAAQYAVEFGPNDEVRPASESNGLSLGKADIDAVVGELYEKYIIPLTKDVEVIFFPISSRSASDSHVQVNYLLQRLDGLSKEEILRMENGGEYRGV
jgi:chorismate mutase